MDFEVPGASEFRTRPKRYLQGPVVLVKLLASMCTYVKQETFLLTDVSDKKVQNY